MRNNLRRFAALIGSVACVALGVNLFILGGLGSDPLTVLQQGMHVCLGITVGQASLLYNGMVILLALLFARRRLGIGTIIYVALVGLFIDLLATPFVGFMPIHPAMKFTCLILGQSIATLGLALLIQLGLGTNGLDALLLTLEEKTNISYRILKTGVDVLYTPAGMLLGGIAGIGTVIAMFSSGTMISMFCKLIQLNKERT